MTVIVLTIEGTFRTVGSIIVRGLSLVCAAVGSAVAFLDLGTIAMAAGARCGGPPVAAALAAPPPAATAIRVRPVLPFVQDGRVDRRGSPAGAVLAGVALPASAGPDASRQLVRRLAGLAGRPVTVFGRDGRRDRRGRVTGQVVVADDHGRVTWLQSLLVSEGLVLVSDDVGGCAEALAVAEEAARRSKRGLFAGSGPGTAATSTALPDLPDFVILEGIVVSVGKSGDTTYLNFGVNRRTDSTVRLSRRISAEFTAEKDISRLTGARVRVRGWAFQRDGLDLSVSAPGVLEVIEEQRAIR
jgi:hypothetical protein